jgi:hypothetical protein
MKEYFIGKVQEKLILNLQRMLIEHIEVIHGISFGNPSIGYMILNLYEKNLEVGYVENGMHVIMILTNNCDI